MSSLWQSEWYWLKEKGDESILNEAKTLFQ